MVGDACTSFDHSTERIRSVTTTGEAAALEQRGEPLDRARSSGRASSPRNDGPFIVCCTRPGDCNVPPTIATAPTTVSGPAPGAQLVVLVDAVLEARLRFGRRPAAAAAPASAVAVSGVFVSTSDDLGRLDSLGSPVGAQRHLPLLAERVDGDGAPGLDRACVLLAREELHVEPRPGERRAVDGAERTGADDDGAFLPEDAHAPSGSSTSRPRVPPASSRRWASAACGEPEGGGDSWRQRLRAGQLQEGLQFRLLTDVRAHADRLDRDLALGLAVEGPQRHDAAAVPDGREQRATDVGRVDQGVHAFRDEVADRGRRTGAAGHDRFSAEAADEAWRLPGRRSRSRAARLRPRPRWRSHRPRLRRR